MLPQRAYNGAMCAQRILGLVMLAMGAGKLSDVNGYAAALAAFCVISAGALHTVAWIWLIAELCAGVLLVLGDRAARWGALLALVINLGYAALTTQAYARHLPIDNCTCFGVHLRQRLSWFVLAQDAYMIAFSAYVYYAARRATRRSPAGSPAGSR
jgi:uncharacterized membrane protein YphA (DoxX/SURF4 family)